MNADALMQLLWVALVVGLGIGVVGAVVSSSGRG